jgi:hypothetical protein
MTGGWYRIDFARSRHTNPARIPVSPLGCWYQIHASQPFGLLVSDQGMRAASKFQSG